jgi:hypothetical protein
MFLQCQGFVNIVVYVVVVATWPEVAEMCIFVVSLVLRALCFHALPSALCVNCLSDSPSADWLICVRGSQSAMAIR